MTIVHRPIVPRHRDGENGEIAPTSGQRGWQPDAAGLEVAGEALGTELTPEARLLEPSVAAGPSPMLPGIGEHTVAVLADLGFGTDEIDTLLAAKVVRQPTAR